MAVAEGLPPAQRGPSAHQHGPLKTLHARATGLRRSCRLETGKKGGDRDSLIKFQNPLYSVPRVPPVFPRPPPPPPPGPPPFSPDLMCPSRIVNSLPFVPD